MNTKNKHVFYRTLESKNNAQQTIVNTEISEEVFDNLFTLVTNPFNQNVSWNGCLLETYGSEAVFALAQPENHIWTLIDSDDSDNTLLLSGRHYINRIGYLITNEPIPENHHYIVNCQ